MGNFGDNLPPNEKDRYIRSKIAPGQIFYLFCATSDKTKKDKFLVVAACSEPLLFFVINSDINSFKKLRPHLIPLQIEIDPSNYPFLDHKSYIDCSKTVEWFTEDEIVNQVIQDMGRIKTELTRETRNKICQEIRSSRVFPLIEKDTIISDLSP